MSTEITSPNIKHKITLQLHTFARLQGSHLALMVKPEHAANLAFAIFCNVSLISTETLKNFMNQNGLRLMAFKLRPSGYIHCASLHKVVYGSAAASTTILCVMCYNVCVNVYGECIWCSIVNAQYFKTLDSLSQ